MQSAVPSVPFIDCTENCSAVFYSQHSPLFHQHLSRYSQIHVLQLKDLNSEFSEGCYILYLVMC